ncbi:hypothetical protein EJ04DRAFT_227977 [Polyplosphaeria fusca]|uniref:Tail specific protease domain-containing protein n=1 Tax=Polyplosphaeria fusca TaxID=682080 RepID=A0A9P4R1B1_9PLEO|nr:hypothetical protein EJ04DRAFT_227977 [Polyplosphaeria fusca]
MRSLILLFAATACAERVVDRNAPRVPTAVEPLPTLFKRDTYQEPCEEVSASWAAAPADATAPVKVSAQLAMDCLKSVPVDVDGDLKEIEELKELVQFQSTLEYLKKGIPEHHEGVDVVARLDDIAKGVSDGAYESDFDVQLDLHLLFLSTGDFHFNWYPDIRDIFVFARQGAQLASFSEDGLKLPELFLQSDLLLSMGGNSSFKPSAVKTINGQNATEYLYNVSLVVDFHTPDAQYNRLFPNQPSLASGGDVDGPWAAPVIYDGPETKFGFENGSSSTIPTIAQIRPGMDFTNVTDGPSFFNAFCQGPPEVAAEEAAPTATLEAASSAVATPSATRTLTPTGYPKPIAQSSSLSFMGYYLNGTYNDVAVVAFPNFEPKIGPGSNETAGTIEYQKMLRKFLADAVKDGKKKLVIDTRGNGGGFIDIGFETFKQLFPDTVPYGGSRYRAHEAFEIFSSALADLALNETLKTKEPELYESIQKGAPTFVFEDILNDTNQPFTSFRDYYGPYEFGNDSFTAIRRYNFSNNIDGYTNAGQGPELTIELTGYLSNSPPPPQPFKPENMVILQDGFCGSTCAIFAELMREQGQVQTIAFGGRPVNAPMQGVGGSKGSQVLTFSFIEQMAKSTLNWTTSIMGPTMGERVNTTAIGRITRTEQLYVRSSRLNPDAEVWFRVNSLNNMRQNDTTQTPLEFVYEAADCRLFYTVAGASDVTLLWQRAADVKWGKGKCVEGSMGEKTAIGMVAQQAFNEDQAASNPNLSDPQDADPNSPQQSNSGSEIRMSRGMMVAIAAVGAALLL